MKQTTWVKTTQCWILLGILFGLFPTTLKAGEWVYDAFTDDIFLLRGSYQYQFQRSHPRRVFSDIHTISVDLEKHWHFFRLFIHDIGVHIAKGSGDPVDFDDLRVGAQIQFEEWGPLYGGFRFWAKVPITRDTKNLGTDITDFWVLAIQSLNLFHLIQLHINVGMGFLGDPNRHKDPNHVFVGGIKLVFPLIIDILPMAVALHGFMGERSDDEKLIAIVSFQYTLLALTLGLDVELPVAGNRVDFADPLNHTSYSGKVYAQLSF